jgi:hypothetical protein
MKSDEVAKSCAGVCNPRQRVGITARSAWRRYTGKAGQMDPLPELLAVDHQQALAFFVLRLQDVAEPDVDRDELLYNASVLAHYAQISTQADVDLPAPADLSAVFDRFVADTTLLHGSVLLETAGAQCLLLAGFFEDQMRRRHNIHWYAELGTGFFGRAAIHERSPRKARLLYAIANRFEFWRRHHARLSRELRDEPFLLTPPSSLQ